VTRAPRNHIDGTQARAKAAFNQPKQAHPTEEETGHATCAHVQQKSMTRLAPQHLTTNQMQQVQGVQALASVTRDERPMEATTRAITTRPRIATEPHEGERKRRGKGVTDKRRQQTQSGERTGTTATTRNIVGLRRLSTNAGRNTDETQVRAASQTNSETEEGRTIT
jgi:hypothetical protein